jgi:hypothetical protein
MVIFVTFNIGRIWMPPSDAAMIHEALSRNEFVDDGEGHYSFSCDVNSILSFSFGDITVNNPPHTYILGLQST